MDASSAWLALDLSIKAMSSRLKQGGRDEGALTWGASWMRMKSTHWSFVSQRHWTQSNTGKQHGSFYKLGVISQCDGNRRKTDQYDSGSCVKRCHHFLSCRVWQMKCVKHGRRVGCNRRFVRSVQSFPRGHEYSSKAVLTEASTHLLAALWKEWC